MKTRSLFILTILVFLVLAVADCGRDTVAPADPATSANLPSLAFFNVTGSTEYVALEGTASDNTSVKQVQLSFNGGGYVTAVIDPPGGASTVEWSYLADVSELPAGTNTILVKAIDSSDNESISSSIVVASEAGSTTAILIAALTNPANGDTIGLSTGSGDAYGDSATAWTIPIDANKVIMGAGTATVLEADPLHPMLFSVSADLYLENVLVKGGELGVAVSDLSGTDPVVTIDGCSFEGQSAWALYAWDDNDGTNLQFLSSVVDSSAADSSSRGGLYLEGVAYFVSGSEFYNHTDPGGPEDSAETGAAVKLIAGSGEITESLFDNNALAIWASGGSPLITSCDVLGSVAPTTFGIKLAGNGMATVRRNTLDGHSGYGLGLGDTMELYFRNNAVTNNNLSGVLIDSRLSNSNLLDIDLGTVSDPGRNLFENNTHAGGNGVYDTHIYVTQATSEGAFLIPANWNYWDYFTLTEIDFSIVDDLDGGGGRAGVNIGDFYTTKGEVGP